MSAISYEDMLEIIVNHGCQYIDGRIDVNEISFGSNEPTLTKTMELTMMALTAQSLDLIDNKINKVVKELDRIATALEQKSHECP